MRVPLEKVPPDVRRRAARAVATMTADHLFARGDRRAPHPTFGAEATPIFRPDLDEIAYWEIELEGIVTALPVSDGEAKEFDRGFIVVATGPHDVPVPHFSLDLAPPSRQLEANGGDIARVVKLDALCYAAEDAAGTLLSHIGTLPPKLDGAPATSPKRLPQGWATSVSVGRGHEQEDGDADTTNRLRRSREKRPIQAGQWRSWEEAKKGYADSYRLHLAALATRAETPWQIEELTEKFGQGIHSGQSFTVLLLEEGKFELTGPGADHVSAELNPQPLPPALILTPTADLRVADTSFDVRLFYRGFEENLSFFIVPEDAPSTASPTLSSLGPVFGGVR